MVIGTVTGELWVVESLAVTVSDPVSVLLYCPAWVNETVGISLSIIVPVKEVGLPSWAFWGSGPRVITTISSGSSIESPIILAASGIWAVPGFIVIGLAGSPE